MKAISPYYKAISPYYKAISPLRLKNKLTFNLCCN